jgi:adenosine kinase
MSVIVSGSVAYDYLMSFPGRFREHILPDQIHQVSLSFLVDSMCKQRGGCAPNIAYSLALLGERPIVMATVGQDFGEYRAWLDASGVDTSAIVEIEGRVHRLVFCQHRLGEQSDCQFLRRGNGPGRPAVLSRL